MKFRTDKDFGFMHAEDAKELKNAVEIIDKALYVNGMLSAPIDGVDYYKVALLAKDEDYLKAVEILNEDGTEQFLPKKDPSIRYVIMSKFKLFRYLREEYTRQLLAAAE